MSDEERKGIEEAEFTHGKYYINTHPDNNKDMSGTASSSALPDPTATTPQPHIPTVTELAQAIGHITLLIGEIGTKVSNLADEVTQLAQLKGATPTPTSVSASSTVACPKAWEGKNRSAEARHFLAAFNNWVFAQDSALNDWDPAITQWRCNNGKWIQAVLNLMEGDARMWALPHLELLSKGTVPFTGSWDKFIADFTKWFILLDVSEAAHEVLKKIQQGKDSIAEYTSKFDQYTTQTGWSDANHHQRFYDGLSDKIKDVLSYTDQPVTTLTQLREAASKVDRCI